MRVREVRELLELARWLSDEMGYLSLEEFLTEMLVLSEGRKLDRGQAREVVKFQLTEALLKRLLETAAKLLGFESLDELRSEWERKRKELEVLRKLALRT